MYNDYDNVQDQQYWDPRYDYKDRYEDMTAATNTLDVVEEIITGITDLSILGMVLGMDMETTMTTMTMITGINLVV